MNNQAKKITAVIKVNFSIFVISAVLMLISAVTAVSQEGQLRPLTTDDLFKLEEIGQTAISPDGEWLAYVIKRSRESALIQTQPFLEGNDRGDVWLVPTAGGKPQNLTNGASDGSGWWSPVWSPDSQRLVIFSTRGDNARLWLWEKSSKRLKQLTESAVDILPGQQSPVVWMNNRQVVCSVLSQGQKPNSMTVEMRAAETAMREWAKAWRGREATASVLESGVSSSLDRRPQGQLLLIDVTKGSQTLAVGYSFRDLRISPDRQHIAALKQVDVARLDPDKPLTPGKSLAIYQAAVYKPDGNSVLTDIANVKDVQLNSLRWSPDGKSLVLIGDLSPGNPQAVICALTSGKCQPLPANDEPVSVLWTGENALLMLPKARPNIKQDWLAFESGKLRNLTEKMKIVPRELIREAGGNTFVGIADGDLWRVYPDGREAQTLTADFEPRITSVFGQTPSADFDGVTRLILNVRKEAQTDWHQIELSSGQITSVTKPRPEAAIVSYNSNNQTAVITAADRTGTYLWLSRAPFTKETTIAETNTDLRRIAQAELKKIEYRSQDGRELKGWVMLPVGYQEGKTYPLITVVYAGGVFGDNPPGMARTVNRASSLNFQLLAAHGYAVLFPSMPLKPEGETSDPYLELTKGVLPAVDKVIERGIADPKRLGLLGQSYGGYAVYGLLTQTNRFQAAISLAGLSDLISLYGVFDARFRYDQFPHERLLMMTLAEAGQLRMGAPPWKDFERYVRNSPLSYVNRIETPLMIVQGDMDYVAIQQGEQIFTALNRQNKRARFIRYWGEGHVLEGQANVRDLWRRISGWFDEFLKPDGVSAK